MDLREPLLGSPFPVRWRGRLISQDLANSSLEVNAVARFVQPPNSVLEIGAGYGRTAYVILSVFPECNYTVVDIEPALSLSRWYLSQLFGTTRLTFLTPSEAISIADRSVDLALSISSLQEMTPEEIRGYLQLIDRVARGYVYLKQWTSWRNSVDKVTTKFDDYPVPARWSPIFKESAPVQVRFTHALWRLAH